ncbi:unnamed protein product, partial [Symbiodinium sp. KB8]
MVDLLLEVAQFCGCLMIGEVSSYLNLGKSAPCLMARLVLGVQLFRKVRWHVADNDAKDYASKGVEAGNGLIKWKEELKKTEFYHIRGFEDACGLVQVLHKVRDIEGSPIHLAGQLLFFHDSRLLHLLIVLIYWMRLLEGVTYSEKIGHALLPLQKLATGLLPAMTFTLVGFCALTHAMYAVQVHTGSTD